MTHRRVFALPVLAMVLVAASACAGHTSSQWKPGTAPRNAGAAAAAPVAPGDPISHGGSTTGGTTAPPQPNFTLTPVPIFEDFSFYRPASASYFTCSWSGGANGTITINIGLTPTHRGGIPGHEPTSVNLHLEDLAGHRSPEYSSGFTAGTFGITEPVAAFDRHMAFNAVVDPSTPDSVPDNDHFRFVVDVYAGTPADWAYLYGSSGALHCNGIYSP